MKLSRSTSLFQSKSKSFDDYLKIYLQLNGILASAFVFLIFLFLIKESFDILFINDLGSFISDSWFPSEGQYNSIPMIIGTLFSSIIALIIAAPTSLFLAIFLSFYCPKKQRFIFKRFIELLSAVPSVIFGFWGLTKLVPLINQYSAPGHSLLAGGLILSMMILPILALSLHSAFEMACKKERSTSLSLGINKSTYIWKILLPNSGPAIKSSLLLSFGRAIGETMAILMVCGNIVQIPNSIFSSIRTLTANIALEMSYAIDIHRSALFLTGFILFLLITLLTIAATKKSIND